MLSLNLNQFYSLQASNASSALDRVSQTLSSGKRINTAADDPAGASVAENFNTLVMGSQQASQNIQQAINLIQVGEDGVQNLLPVMQRMRQLVLQAANGTNSDQDRAAIQQELDQIKQMVPQAYQEAHNARINLDGKNGSDRILDFQVGPNAGDTISVDYNALRGVMQQLVIKSFGYTELYNSPFQEQLTGLVGSTGAGPPKPTDPIPPAAAAALNIPYTPGMTFAQAFPKLVDVTPQTPGSTVPYAQFTSALSVIDAGLQGLEGQASYLGAMQNRFEMTSSTISEMTVTFQQSLSTIRDTDMAQAATEMTRAQIVQQSSIAILSQANQRASSVLSLLK